MIISTSIIDYQNIISPAETDFNNGRVFPQNGHTKAYVGGVEQNVVTNPIEVEPGEEIEFRVDEYTNPDYEHIEDEKKKIGWAIWVEGDPMNGAVAPDARYIIINNKVEGNDVNEDFTGITNVSQYKAYFESFAYMFADQKLFETSPGNQAVNTVNQLFLKFSKWLDSKTIVIEPFRGNPERNGNVDTSPAVRVTVKATKEITRVYWENAGGQTITSTGYNRTINLCIETLGYIDSNPNTISVKVEDTTFPTSQAGGIQIYNNANFAVTARRMVIPIVIDTLAHYQASVDSGLTWTDVLDLVVTINNNNANTNLRVTTAQTVTVAYFAQNTGTAQIPIYKKIDKHYIGDEIYLVAECPHLINGTTLTFEVREHTALLGAVDSVIGIYRHTQGATFVSDNSVNGTVTNGFAVARIKLNQIGSNTFNNWMNALFTNNDFSDAELYIRVTCAQPVFDNTFLNDNGRRAKLRARVKRFRTYYADARVTETKLKDPARAQYFYYDKNGREHQLGTYNVLKIRGLSRGLGDDEDHPITIPLPVVPGNPASLNGYFPQGATTIYDQYWGADHQRQNGEGWCREHRVYPNGVAPDPSYMVLSWGRLNDFGALGWRQYRAAGNQMVDLLEMPSNNNNGLQYTYTDTLNDNFVTNIRFTYNDTLRRYCDPANFAGFIGVLGEHNYTDIVCNGMANIDGSCHPSVSHNNGKSVDTAYLPNLTGNNFSAANRLRQKKIILAFKRYGFTQRIIGNDHHNITVTVNGEEERYFTLGTDHTSHNRLHNSHLHCGLANNGSVKTDIVIEY
ncbi:MAG TPA: hypothetical protein VEC12_09870 [Bacteroidia bacterium]|nr:hypothetical protein [Bacteroidia bacterium]